MQPVESRSPAAPFSEVLSVAMASRNLALDRLVAKLRAAGTPVSAATLSYWRSGRSVPTRGKSIRAIEELERILQVRPGHLSGALPGDAFTRWDPLPVLNEAELVSDVLAGMGLDLDRRLTQIVGLDSVIVDADGCQRSTFVQQLCRCDADGTVSFPVVYHQRAEVEEAPTIQAGPGCRLGRVVSMPDRHLIIGEMLLPRPFDRGEMVSVTHTVQWVPAPPQLNNDIERSLPSVSRYQTFEVQFQGRLPQAFRQHSRPTYQTEPEPVREIPVSPFVQVVITDALPGVHALAWQW